MDLYSIRNQRISPNEEFPLLCFRSAHALLRDRLVPQLATTGSEALGSPGEARAAEEAVCTHNSCWSEQTSAVLLGFDETGTAGLLRLRGRRFHIVEWIPPPSGTSRHRFTRNSLIPTSGIAYATQLPPRSVNWINVHNERSPPV
ncbi:hypothetical protein QYF36_010664 [Acer negundo]|nr:hypothetical protein QYF36_010664 [Acer negundo]